jgi:hypothetical protein
VGGAAGRGDRQHGGDLITLPVLCAKTGNLLHMSAAAVAETFSVIECQLHLRVAGIAAAEAAIEHLINTHPANARERLTHLQARIRT